MSNLKALILLILLAEYTIPNLYCGNGLNSKLGNLKTLGSGEFTSGSVVVIIKTLCPFFLNSLSSVTIELTTPFICVLYVSVKIQTLRLSP